MVHRQRRSRMLETADCAELDRQTGTGGDVKRFERILVELQSWIDLENGSIDVQLREIAGHLALSVGIVQSIVDRLSGYVEARHRVPVELNRHPRRSRIDVGLDVADHRD